MKAIDSHQRLLHKAQFIFLTGIVCLTAYFIYSSYHLHLDQSERGVQRELRAMVNTTAQFIDADLHAKVMREHTSRDAISDKRPDADYEKIRSVLLLAQRRNGLNTPIYTIVMDSSLKVDNRPRMLFGVTSNAIPYFRHNYHDYPEDLCNRFAEGSVLSPYKDRHGSWISAFAPIISDRGEVVAVVMADRPFDQFRSDAIAEMWRNIGVSLLIAMALGLFLNQFMKRVLSQQEIMQRLRVSLDEAEEAKVRAEKASRAKAEFLSNMSHEIRTPLNAVVGLSHHLMEQSADEQQYESLRILKFSANNLMMLVNDILDFSKIEAGRIEFEEVAFNLKELGSSIIHSHRIRAEEKGIEIECTLDPALGERFIGDPTRIGQVLNNLVSNAVKFTEEGWVHLQATLVETEGPSSRIRFEVHDSGIGIPPEKHAEIFENFSQAQGDTTRKYGGTGLGLAITKRLIELMGSQITLESALGEGSKFSFELDLDHAVLEVVAPEEVTVQEQEKLSGFRVLIAEDNEINTFVLRKFMEKWDLTADYAVNGLEALEKAKTGSYDLVLMDLQMPEMDGYEATRQIRAIGTKAFSNLPIVALTASAMIEIQDKAYAVGMNDYVSKPFNPDELYQKIARYVRHTNAA